MNCWNTIPVSRRISWMLRMSWVSSTPSTTIRPASCSSSRLMQRIIVDLPEPDGPMTTTTSCRPTLRSMSRSAWNVAEALVARPRSSIIASPVPADLRGVGEHGCGRLASRSSCSHSQSSFEALALPAHRDAPDPEQQHRRTRASRRCRPWPRNVRLRRDRLGDVEQLEQAHRRAGQRGVLEQADELPDDAPGSRCAAPAAARSGTSSSTGDSPSAWAASVWPRGSDCRPPRTISAM